MFCASALAPPGTPIGSSVAVVWAYGFCFRPRAIQTRARRPLDQLGLLVDDEERDAVRPGPVVGGAGDDRDVLSRVHARAPPGSLEALRSSSVDSPSLLLPELPQPAKASAQPSAMRAAAGRITARV